ncbi:hypothetical protein HDU67_002684 [Dinochytrium kinnereticum]|nr:hypothetical protein HDU67_002684 [Dinochytrium kinnereticum]
MIPSNLTSAARKRSIKKLTAAIPGTPLFGFGHLPIKRLADIASQLIERRLAPKSKARRWWDLVRSHVRQGFFQSLLKTREETTSDFLSLVERMWTLVHKYAPDEQARQAKDSTTEFVLAGWAKIKAAQHAVARLKARKSIDTLPVDLHKNRNNNNINDRPQTEKSESASTDRIAGDGNDDTIGRKSRVPGTAGLNDAVNGYNAFDSAEDEADAREFDDSPERSGTHGRGSLGIEGLSFDTVPNVNVSQVLKRMADGLYEQPVDEADFYTVQVHFNRAWKLLLLGLTQAESFARYMSMCAIRRAIPIINDTLLDSTTRENLILVLANLMISDERKENRLKAVYLLGQLGLHLGSVREHDHLLLRAFKELARRLLEIQYEEKASQDPTAKFKPDLRALKIYLLHAIGKFTRYVHRSSRYMEDLVVYMLHEEFAVGDTKLASKGGGGGGGNASKQQSHQTVEKSESIYVIRALLAVLDNEMKHTDYNEKYIGAIFKTFVHPLMRVSNQGMQMMAVQFISNWLPITNEDAVMIGLETLEAGLKATKELGVPNFRKEQYELEMRNLRKRRISEESRMAIRSKLLRQLLQMPGTYAKLRPAQDHPGFFVDVDSSMMNTKGIVVSLPIHPKSSVTLTRPLPPIPGVPLAVTTIPPVFMEQAWAEKLPPPKFKYEFLERTGAIPGLPYGYTYTPSLLVDVYAMKGIDPKESSNTSSTQLMKKTTTQPPVPGSTRSSVRASGAVRPFKDRAAGSIKPLQGATIPESGDQPMPLLGKRASMNPAQARLLIAAAGESKRGNQRGSSKASTGGFGFVRRSSVSEKHVKGGSAGKPRRRNSEIKPGPIPTGMIRAPPKEEARPESRDMVRSSNVKDRDIASSEGKKMPAGFLTMCPFPGYDPDRFDKSVPIVSAIYQRIRGGVRGSRSGGSDGGDVSSDFGTPASRGSGSRGSDLIPTGFTGDRNPVLWPHRQQGLNTVTQLTDFPVFAPVLFDIIQPGTTNLQRVLCQVTSINKDISAVSVQKGGSNDNLLSVGATFNLFIRSRSNPEEWNCINLEVIDDDYQDNYVFGSIRPKGASGSGSIASSVGSLLSMSRISPNRGDMRRGSITPMRGPGASSAGSNSGGTGLPSNFPHPAGFTNNGDPYFAPPVNLPPIPGGYTSENVPYFGKTAMVKPQAAGMTTDGIRFYSPDGKLGEGSRNQIAGYDNNGQPFYIPRGCTLPPPVGFTTDGIAYYDIPSLMHHRGIMILPMSKTDQANWPTFDEEEDLFIETSDSDEEHEEVRKKGREPRLIRVPGKKIDSMALTNALISTLEAVQPELKQSFFNSRPRAIGTIHRLRDYSRAGFENGLYSDIDEEAIADPSDTVAFLKESEDFAYLKPTHMRVAIEPSVLDFQSVNAPVTKVAVLRYRAGRGDHEERDFFVSVLPTDIFVVQSFHLRLQGEGVAQITLTYYPRAMQSDRVEGSMSLIDDTGKKLAFCSLIALRQSFVRISPTFIDAGWILRERKKEIQLKAENVSSSVATLTLDLQSDIEEQTASLAAAAMLAGQEGITPDAIIESIGRQKPFSLSIKSVRMQPGESKQISVIFEPANLGRFADVLVISAPGGDVIKVNVQGIAGIPIALYPEGRDNSLAGGEALTRERSDFMKKFRRAESSLPRTHIPLTNDDVNIIQNMMSATADAESRKEAHTLDFGICSAEPQTIMRCVTIMNLSDSMITIGLFPHNPAVTCPYLVRIPPRMANTVEVVLNIGEGNGAMKGNLRTAIEVICPEFQNIPLYILAYIGQPTFFPTWDFAFFKPCLPGQTEQLTLTLVNDSHYDISFVLQGLGNNDKKNPRLNFFSATASQDEEEPSKIRAFSILPVVIGFTGVIRGPLMKRLSIRLLKPFNVDFNAAISGNPLSIIGICLEPYRHRPGELPDKNGIDFLRMWMSHPKRLIDEYPAEESEKEKRFDLSSVAVQKRPMSDTPNCEVNFFKDSLVFRQPRPDRVSDDTHMRRSQILPIMVQHRGTKELSTDFFGSTLFNIDPRSRDMRKGDTVNFDVMFTPPHDAVDHITTFGFGIAIVQEDHSFHAIQLMSQPFTDFLVYPLVGKDGNVIIDFGRVELSSSALDIHTKFLVLCNTHNTSFSWNLKLVSSKTKFTAFEAAMNFGELHSFETYAVPFKFHCDTSGVFESIAEISIKETMDRLAKPAKITNVILRGQTVNTSLSGFPDGIDFGSTVVMHKKKRRFVISNTGTTEAMVTLLTRPPFVITPKSFQIAPKVSQELVVTFSPTESRTSTVKMLIFSNQKLYLIPLVGVGGTAELICEKYDSKDIDFGNQREGTVAWLSVYLTNKGTLPLSIKAITADLPELIKVEFLNVTSTVPYEGNQLSSKAQVSIRKDYWGIIRRKMKVFAILNGLTKKHISEAALKGIRRAGGGQEEDGIPVSVFKKGSINVMEQTMIPAIPQLRPFYSYHFRLGYLNKYQPRKETDIQFHYMPITTDEEITNLPSLLKSMSVRVVGNVYRPLEFFPPFHDFGLAPAESWSAVDNRRNYQWRLNENYGVFRSGQSKEGSTFYLQVLNMSMEAQNLSLQFINTEFWVSGRQWHVLPGEKLEVPIEFHPSKEQLQYRGEARFVHNYGVQTIRLSGTGASADLSADDVLDFESLKLGSIGKRSLRLTNRGLIECRYRLELIQPSTDYRLLNDEPFEHEGVVASGSTELLDVECSCQREISGKATVVVRWERIPRGIWEEITIPIAVQIGVPLFRLSSMELDFKTTYINVNKTLEIEIENDGNASCLWSAESKSPLLIIDPDNGSIPPGDSIFVEITYVPENYTPLSSEIVFTTDVGVKTLMCYGIVGIPYLMIPEEAMNLNFGISAIDKTHTRPVIFSNTSAKPIEYEIVISDLLKDGIPSRPDEFEIFFANPTHGVIPPNSTASVSFQAVPKDYNSTVSATFTVRTRDGEQYIGHLTATGGKAIIKIAPPTVAEEIGVRTQTAEMKKVKPLSRGKSSTPKISHFETARLAFQSHIENLQDVLAGLRTAEMEASEEQRNRRRKQMQSSDTSGRTTASMESGSTRDLKDSENDERISSNQAKGKSSSHTPRDNEEGLKDYNNLVNILSKSSGRLLGNAKALQETLEKAKSARKGTTAPEGKRSNSRGGSASDAIESRERSQSQKSGRRDISTALTPYEANLLEKAGEEQRRRMSSGTRIFDGSDLRTRVKRAAGSSRVVGSAQALVHGKGAGANSDGEILGRKTASGRVRLQSKPATALKHIDDSQENSDSNREGGFSKSDQPDARSDFNIDDPPERQRSAPRSSASARRRRAAITEDHTEIEESTAVRYLDQLSTLEAELEELTTALQADINATSAPISPQAGIGRYNPGTPRRAARSREHEKSSFSSKKAHGRSRTKRSRPAKELRNQEEDSGMAEVAAEFDSVRRPVEDLMALAQQMVSDTSAIVDPKVQKDLLEEINNKIIESTRGVIKAVKDQLANRWIVNREFLSSALRKVQQTTHIMEALSVAEPQSEKLENDFNIGLIRGGNRLTDVLLFNLPNCGNLPFDFEIKEDETLSLRPQDVDLSDQTVELFKLSPMKGEIQPEMGANISANFSAKTSGVYQQGFYVMSGGDRVLSFTVTAKVGNPKIKIEPPLLDFGLIRRGRSEVRTIIISNTGTYKDYWRIEMLTTMKINDEDLLRNTESVQPAFTLSALKGELEPGDAFPLNVTFRPPQEGAFDIEFIVHWSSNPILVKLSGIGGGARTKATYLCEEDIKFNGLDWGICIVGVKYEKIFQLSNIGNVEGLFNITHSSQSMTFDVPRDQNGFVHIAPNSFVPIKMFYTPTQPEVTKESIQIAIPDSPVYLVPLRAQSGVCDWQITGELTLKNMPMTDIQICTVTVSNTGGLDIPFEWTVDTDEDVKKIMRVVVKEQKGVNNPPTMILKPRQTVHVDVTITPKDHIHIFGSLILTTDLGKGKQSKALPFDFFAYSEQVALDSRKDISVGRIMVGQTAEVLRSLTNFGADNVKYRIRLETLNDSTEMGSAGSLANETGPLTKGKKGKKAPQRSVSKTLASATSLKKLTSPWKLKGTSEGILLPNETVNIEAIFESINEDGDEWHEAKLIVEKCDDELHDKWSELSSIKMLGAGGTPKLVIDPEVIEFGHFGIGFEKSMPVVFRNEGTAVLEYEIQSPWDFDGNIYLSEGTSLTGKLNSQESMEVILRFRPTEVISYETNITLKYQIGVKQVKILGQGCASYQFFKDSLPNNLQFGSIGFGDSAEKTVTIHNDCIFPIAVKGEVTATDPDSSEEQKESDCLSLSPGIIELPPNSSAFPSSESERTSAKFQIKLFIPVPLDNNGNGDSNQIAALLAKGTKRHFIKLSTINGSGYSGSQVVPVTFTCITHRLTPITHSKFKSMVNTGNTRILDSDIVKSFDFGESSMSSGASQVFVMHNPNLFRLSIESSTTEKQFRLQPSSGSISAGGYKEFEIFLDGLQLDDTDEDVPSNVSFSGMLKIKSHIPSVPETELSLYGSLIDETPSLVFSQPIQFGSIKRFFTTEQCVEFRNPVRRQMPYKFTVDKQFADIFQIPSNLVSGIAKPRELIRIPVKFCPKAGVSYSASAFLETGEGNHVIQLQGRGVEPQIAIDKQKVAFGVVGVGAPEFRRIHVSNPSDVPIRMGLSTNDTNFLTDIPDEFVLAPGESREVQVIFAPPDMEAPRKAEISFLNLDLRPGQKEADVLGTIELEGTGGNCDFTFGGEEDEDVERPSSGIPTINVNFPKVIIGQKAKKYFEVVNCGDTVVDIAIVTEAGSDMQDDVELQTEKVCYSIVPASAVIQPKIKQKFTVTLKGVKVGEDHFSMQVRTRTLTEAKCIPINVKATVLSPDSLLQDSIRAFARADNNFEAIIDIMAQEENRFSSERNLWKVLLPVERVGPLLPSMELQSLPSAEPIIEPIDLTTYVIRPPAIPRELPPRAKKWYMNRVSMALDQGTKSRNGEPRERDALRRQEALNFVRPIEKQVLEQYL